VKHLATALLLPLLVWPVAGQDTKQDDTMKNCPMHDQHTKTSSQHQADVEKHGDEAMGFPHDKTTHHFRLYADGGAIEVTANDAKDTASTQTIRFHLAHIATMFSAGDFSIPMFVHDQGPPGVDVMKKQSNEISYGFEELPSGGRVRITTSSEDTLNAVHDFLRFQIKDHHTGDSAEISVP
jgi:hypothetical protein